jgi:hypothetical protein
MLARVCTPSSPVRERERERESEKEGERDKCRICREWLFLFLKGMTGALAPFSYQVQYMNAEFHNIELYKIVHNYKSYRIL